MPNLQLGTLCVPMLVRFSSMCPKCFGRVQSDCSHVWSDCTYSLAETSRSFSSVLYCTVLYCTVLYCTVLYCTVLYCTALYCTVLYCTVLYCTVHYFSPWSVTRCFGIACPGNSTSMRPSIPPTSGTHNLLAKQIQFETQCKDPPSEQHESRVVCDTQIMNVHTKCMVDDVCFGSCWFLSHCSHLTTFAPCTYTYGHLVARRISIFGSLKQYPNCACKRRTATLAVRCSFTTLSVLQTRHKVFLAVKVPPAKPVHVSIGRTHAGSLSVGQRFSSWADRSTI